MRIVRDYWSQYLTGLSSLGLAIGSLGFVWRGNPSPPLLERWEIWTFWCSALATVVAIIGTARNSQSVTLLTKERDSLQSSVDKLQSLEEEIQQKYSDLSALHLTGLMRRMGLSENDRVSIYKHNGYSFYRIARHSNHPEHSRPGRSIYPDDQGCMGEALRLGFAFEETLPAKPAGYAARLSQRWHMDDESIGGLTMRSRSIAAYALHRPVGGKRFAIIVFESMVPGSIDTDCRNRFSPDEQASIIQWLQTMERFEPKPNEAKQGGFQWQKPLTHWHTSRQKQIRQFLSAY